MSEELIAKLRAPLMLHANPEQTNAERSEAATEIERMQTALGYHVNELQEARRQAIRDAAEIERLRAALESLTEDPEPTLDEPDADWEVIVKMRAIAREALNAAPKQPGAT